MEGLVERMRYIVTASKRLVIYAYPASGKTTFQNLIRNKFGASFVDTDDYIEEKPYTEDDMGEIAFQLQVRIAFIEPYLVFTNLHNENFIYWLKYMGFTTVAVLIPDDEYERRVTARRLEDSNFPEVLNLENRNATDIDHFDLIVDDFDKVKDLVTTNVSHINNVGFPIEKRFFHKFDRWWVVMYLSAISCLSKVFRVCLLGVSSSSFEIYQEMELNIDIYSDEIKSKFSVKSLVPEEYDMVFTLDSRYPQFSSIVEYYRLGSTISLYDFYLFAKRLYPRTFSLNIGISRPNALVSGYYVSHMEKFMYRSDFQKRLSDFPFTMRVRIMTPLLRALLGQSEAEFKEVRTRKFVEYCTNRKLRYEVDDGEENTGYLWVGRRKKRTRITISVSGHFVNILLSNWLVPTYPDWYIKQVETNIKDAVARRCTDTPEACEVGLWHNYWDYVIAVDVAEYFAKSFDFFLDDKITAYVRDQLDSLAKVYPIFKS